MKIQNYNNHKQYYAAHHFLFYPAVILLFIVSICGAFKSNENTLLWLVIIGIITLITWLALMVRQHYALGNQDRIARVELRLRYYTLTQKHFELIEDQLELSQILALRFAPNEELINLIDRTLQENLSSTEIKKSIKNWLPDNMRV